MSSAAYPTTHFQTSVDRQQQRFLMCYAEVGQVLAAARWARIDRAKHYDWLHDPEYRRKFREARTRAAQRLEDEAVQRGRYGLSKPVLYKGKQVFIDGRPLYERVCSDMLLMRLLEANDPERFKPRLETNQAWDGDLSKLNDQQVGAIVEQLLRQVTGGDPAKIAELKKQAQIEAGTVPASQQTVDVQVERNQSVTSCDAHSGTDVTAQRY